MERTKKILRYLPLLGIVAILTFSLGFYGCAGGEEMTAEEEQGVSIGEEPADQAPKEVQKPSEEDAALSAFIGEKKEEPKPQPQPDQQFVAPTPAPVTADAGRLDALEQENRGLTARLAQLEQKLMEEKERADRETIRADAERERAQKYETTLKAVAQTPAESAAVATPETAEAAPKPEVAAVSPSLEEYGNALTLFNSKDYDASMAKLEGMLKSGGIDPNYEDNVEYWLGETYYAKRMYKDAVAQFEKVLKFAKSEKLADANFMIAQCHQRLGDKKAAKAAYETVVKDFPSSPKAKTAKQRWAQL